MKLVHCTNYTSKCIETWKGDDEVPFTVIWEQAMNDNEPCYVNFGPREVQVVNSDFEKADPHDWSVCYVNGAHGRSKDHYFHKFVIIQQVTNDYIERDCTSRGWKFVVQSHQAQPLKTLRSFCTKNSENEEEEKLQSLQKDRG